MSHEVIDTVTEAVIARESGLSVKALQRKRQRGDLPIGQVWWKDGRSVVYSRKGFESVVWCLQGNAGHTILWFGAQD
jgi:hypothetical protein